MKKLSNSKSQQNISLKSKNACAPYRPFFQLRFFKKFNLFGYFFLLGGYTAGVVFLTLFYSAPKKQMSAPSVVTKSLKQEIVLEMKQLLEERERKRAERERSPVELAKLKESLLKEVRDLNLKYFDLIMKERVAGEGIARRKVEALRKPAVSFSEGEKKSGKGLLYNYKNIQIVKQMHKMELERLEKQIAKEKKEFFKKLDLTKFEDRQKWIKFQESQKLKLVALKAEHSQQRKHFREEKFILVDRGL